MPDKECYQQLYKAELERVAGDGGVPYSAIKIKPTNKENKND